MSSQILLKQWSERPPTRFNRAENQLDDAMRVYVAIAFSGQLNFTLDVTGFPDSSLDDAFFEIRMDVGVQGGDLHYVNVAGPVTDGTDNEGL